MKYLISIILFLPSLALSDAKVLNCTESYDAVKKEWQAIFDTNDFSKENPDFEYTLLSFTSGGESTIYEPLVGNKYSAKYKVTPSTLSFSICLAEKVGSRCIISGISIVETYNVSRKDLSTTDGKCTIKDYMPSNLI